MKIIHFALLLLTMPMGAFAQTPPTSPADLLAHPTPDQLASANVAKYHDANAQLPAPAAGEKRIIFFGDSITEAWAGDPNFFPGKSYIGRGISGQTTTQMLIRFHPDVIDLHPAVVVILAGTNDIAENGGPITLEAIETNLETMAKAAQAAGIKPILCSVLPAFDYGWHPGLHPDQKIPKLNLLIKAYCDQNHVAYLDYFPALVNPQNGMKQELSKDGVHPNSAGYAIMESMASKAIADALATP